MRREPHVSARRAKIKAKMRERSCCVRVQRAVCVCARKRNAQRRRKKVAKEVEEAPSFYDDANHRPSVEHERDAAEEARGALRLPLLEEEAVGLRRPDDEHHAGEEEKLRAREFEKAQR